MIKAETSKPHIVFLFSDTGGGHRSASEAIIEAIDLEFPGKFTCEMVDFFKEYLTFKSSWTSISFDVSDGVHVGIHI